MSIVNHPRNKLDKLWQDLSGEERREEEKGGRMKARIDPEICIGCGLCVDTYPGVYKMEGDKAVVYVSIVPKESEETCKKGADECPVTAIFIE